MRPASHVTGFLRTYALPAVLLFALPLFAQWFAGHATGRFDRELLEVIEGQIAADKDLSADERERALAYYRATPASSACLAQGEELASFRESLGDACSDVRHFDGMRRVGQAATALGLLTALIALLCAGAAFISRPFQYGSFVVGWNVLRVSSALQALAQGGLAVWLSFWMTAVWFERYFLKIILMVGLLAAGALFLVLMAIFKRPPMDHTVEAEPVPEERAPQFWAHLRALAERLGTQAPDHVLAGIDDNFFVTEAPVRVGEQLLQGRTLYVSLSLLRMLERSEADAVLAHELGHLLGGDTGHGKRLSPLLARFEQYLTALHEGVLTRPIFHFMLAYYGLFQLSLGRSRRQSELAADRLAASVTSPADIARSLVKIGAYASFRARVESELFAKNEQQDTLAIAERVGLGFAKYAGSEVAGEDVYGSVTPHPFDSHPSLSARLQNVGHADFAPAELVTVLLSPATSPWTDALLDAQAIEERLWGAYEARFNEAHDLALAYRYEPSNAQERAHVERYFPPLTFEGKEADAPTVTLDCLQLTCTGWEEPLPLAQVASASRQERLFKKYLDLKLVGGGLFKGTRSICLSKLQDADGMVQAFEQYYGRYRQMAARREKEREAA